MADWRCTPSALMAAAVRCLDSAENEKYQAHIEQLIGIPCSQVDRDRLEHGRIYERQKRRAVDLSGANKLIWC